MAGNFKTLDRDQIFLVPPSLQEWIPENDIVHFVIEAAELVPVSDFQIKDNGGGKAQYQPQMMLALLLYCYSHGIFSSRKIERSTYKDVAVRFLCANQHPDHNTICIFRRNNERAISAAFLHILKLAKELGILKVGTVSTDGTKIKANASIHKSLRYDRAAELEKELQQEIESMKEEPARSLYRLRKQTVEPFFGIVKEAPGFRQFHLRGLEKVNIEWTLLTTAYNVKRLAKILN
jgi:transposase